jgi:hypothetical protein
MLLPGTAIAGKDEKITKERRISKTYIVNSNAGLDVSNKYGQIYVTTWDENKTSIEVTIRVSAKNEEIVDKRLNSIDIEFEAVKTLIKAKTLIGNFSGRNINMEINYTIKIPKNGTINLNNQYGAIKLGVINGDSNIKCQYGNLSAEELNSNNNIIRIEYCGKSKINYMKMGDVKASYSDFMLTKGNILKINGEYTNINITDINDLNFRTDYGDLKIINANKVSGTNEYSSFRIAALSGQLNLTTNYGDINIARVEKSTKNIAINSTYTNVAVKYDDSYPFDFEYKLEYGNLSGTSGLKFTEKKEKDFSSYYKGFNINSGENRIYIKAEFGNIVLSRL